MPLYSGLKAREVDGREIKLVSAECSDLLLRGCIRGSPAPSVGLFFKGVYCESRKTSRPNNQR